MTNHYFQQIALICYLHLYKEFHFVMYKCSAITVVFIIQGSLQFNEALLFSLWQIPSPACPGCGKSSEEPGGVTRDTE